jgi:thioesterase domain-containing protein
VYRFYDLLNRAVIAKRRYEVKPYDGKVILFRVSEQAPDRLFEVDPTLGWGRWCANLEICDLPGGHGDLGKNPQAAERFYGKMNELLSVTGAGQND